MLERDNQLCVCKRVWYGSCDRRYTCTCSVRDFCCWYVAAHVTVRCIGFAEHVPKWLSLQCTECLLFGGSAVSGFVGILPELDVSLLTVDGG